MGRIRVCVGRVAANPYVMKQSGVRLYSLEELCYELCSNAVLIDEDTVTPEMAEWIGDELGLAELAKGLRLLMKSGNPPEGCVRRILEECHYCGRERLDEIAAIVRRNAGLDSGEKKKRRIDHLAAAGKYEQALSEYRKLLLSAEGRDIALTASVYHAMGCIEAQMFRFSLAETYFDKAYRLTYHRESLRCYVCAVRMHGTKQEQERKLAASPERKAFAAEADGQIAACRAAFRETDSYAGVSELTKQWENGRQPEYYARVAEIMSDLKETYRKQCERTDV